MQGSHYQHSQAVPVLQNNNKHNLFTSRSNDSHAQEPPRKRTRCLRSCLACRRAKQRCQLPDSFVEPSELPLTIDLACRRCQVLEQECFVVDSVPKAGTTGNRVRRAAKSSDSAPPQHAMQFSSISTSTSQGWKSDKHTLSSPPVPLPNHHARSNSSTSRFESNKQSNEDHHSNSESGSDPHAINDLRIFEPEETVECEDGSGNIANAQGESMLVQSSPKSKSKKSKDWMKVGRTVCRPFELLGYLLKRQPIAQLQIIQNQSPAGAMMEIIASFKDLRLKYEAE